jgi:hypothetical protein
MASEQDARVGLSFLRRSFSRFVNAVRPGGAESELAREIRSHLALLEDEFQRRGMSIEEARFAARRAFGGVEQAKELRRRDAAVRAHRPGCVLCACTPGDADRCDGSPPIRVACGRTIL